MPTRRRADMFTADGAPSDDDPREHLPRPDDERSTLAQSLQRQRMTLRLKCADLDAEAMARRAVPPSTMSLLGLVRHLAEVERGTFRRLLAGQDAARLYMTADDPDGDFTGAVPDDEVVAEAWRAWQAEVEFAEKFVAATDLGRMVGDPANEHGSGGGDMQVRELLVGMIEEYSRHLGHVDLLRECLDGRLGQ